MSFYKLAVNKLRVGILSVQGDFEAHADVLERLNVASVFVTHPKHLSGIQGLILPGGESTAMLKFLLEEGFIEAIKEFALAGRCLYGTCAGAILLADEVVNPSQQSLHLIDATVERNAFGRQIASRISEGICFDKPMEMVFIRAPRIVRLGKKATAFAYYEGQPVGVTQDRYMMTTFHPELTQDVSVHELFVELCRKSVAEYPPS
ncbi:MAG: pyridoxal 5'-phosphate synthase glutaminase subunit PdxT [Gammaproteobacteria bacterium]|nr:pyridoxal 5'-phosphate synthase glutaminase subunit PdxT [Gammaproteobacteria bacterium]